jgi:hypothetical protein
MPLAGLYRPDPTEPCWTPISDHASRYVDELADPWTEWELGLRVHDEVIARGYGEDAWTAFLLAHDPAVSR